MKLALPTFIAINAFKTIFASPRTYTTDVVTIRVVNASTTLLNAIQSIRPTITFCIIPKCFFFSYTHNVNIYFSRLLIKKSILIFFAIVHNDMTLPWSHWTPFQPGWHPPTHFPVVPSQVYCSIQVMLQLYAHLIPYFPNGHSIKLIQF